jgi:hypothetical protein
MPGGVAGGVGVLGGLMSVGGVDVTGEGVLVAGGV